MNTQSCTPLAYFAIESSVDEIFAQLFEVSEDGELKFGFTASSIGKSDRAIIESGTDFRDYILEGSVKYRIKLVPSTFGCILGVGSYGENRVGAIIPAVKHYLRSANVEAIQTAMSDPPPSVL